MWDGTDWIHKDLLGKYFDLRETTVKNFYLRYANYIVYQSDYDKVFLKSLKDQSEPELLLESCVDFQVRQDSVFILHKDATSQETHVFIWDDGRLKFEKIYCHEEFGATKLDYHPNTGSIYTLDVCSKQFYGFKNENGWLKVEKFQQFCGNYTSFMVIPNPTFDIVLQKEFVGDDNFRKVSSSNLGTGVFEQPNTKHAIRHRLGVALLCIDKDNCHLNMYRTHLLDKNLKGKHESSSNKRLRP